MKKEPIVSVLNLKSGVGCSTLTWNIAHILDLNIFQHDRALHKYFIEQRNESVKNGTLFTNKIKVENIDKKKFSSGVYDLGSDINYPYVKQVLKLSSAIVVPIEMGYEVLLKSIATLKYILANNDKSPIFIVLNRLDSNDPIRERKYSSEAKDFILSHIDNENIKFLYLRHSFAIYRNLAEGFYFLDNYIYQEEEFKPISSFNLLRNLRWHTVDKMKDTKRFEKAEEEMERTTFFIKHKNFFEEYVGDADISKIYNLKFNDNHRKLVKDMLKLTTLIRDQYLPRWENINE